MREAELLTHIYSRSAGLSGVFPRVLVGPGDDCAVLGVGAVAGGAAVLLKTDQVIEGRHFVRGTPLDLVARKAIARAVSDIAAMAGTPTAILAACALPRGMTQEDANTLFEACAAWSQRFGAPLVGGDIATFAANGAGLTLTITAVGEAHTVRGGVLRSTARVGDHLYITGRIGGSFDAETGMGRHLTFEPRVKEAAWLADELNHDLHAMMDLSDGLGIDAGRMAAASSVQLELTLPPECLQLGAAGPTLEATLRAISQGEDYELLFAVDPARQVPPVCPATGTMLTRIGVCRGGEGAVLVADNGERVEIHRLGWEHS